MMIKKLFFFTKKRSKKDRYLLAQPLLDKMQFNFNNYNLGPEVNIKKLKNLNLNQIKAINQSIIKKHIFSLL